MPVMLPRMISGRARFVSFVAVAGAALVVVGCSRSIEGEAIASETPTGAPRATATSSAPSTTTTPAPKPADPDDYAATSDGVYYFTSESGRFGCAILVHTSPLAGCQGDMPASAPRVPGSGAPDMLVPANALMLAADGPGEWVGIGEISFMEFGGAPKTLPYGRTLTVDPFTCVVDEKTGVTCETDEHGFTVSDIGGEVW
ncbi:Uncharacterised protein [Rhodococcus gordoniae]|uniref:Lipoprotein n=2 Tax=Nocardiaceae TaxID=85025 RepID=A0A379M4Q2_9NOCA|nr:Uncharacterised protein [Rhodococcus gordoniae]